MRGIVALLLGAAAALVLALLVPAARSAVAILASLALLAVAAWLWAWRRRERRLIAFADALLAGRADERPPLLRHELAEGLGARLAELQRRLGELAREEARQRALLDTVLSQLDEGVAVLDALDRIAYANTAWRHLTAGGSVPGTALYEQLPAAPLASALAAGRAEGRAVTPIFEHRRRHLRAVVVRIDQERIAVIVQDQTELRSAERSRREFVAAVSHELKTPLTAITGFTETLLEGTLEQDPAQARVFVEKIARHAERLTTLVRDVLTLSRLEQGAWEVRPEPCEVMELVRHIVDEHQLAAAERRVRFSIEGPPSMMVVSDRELLHQLLGNLVSNAVRYNRPGGAVTIRVGGDSSRLRFQVIDTGIGIPPEHQERIFDRFYRVDAHRSRATGGTGLGLAIVKELVDTLHGTIGLASSPAGTTFTVELPCSETRHALRTAAAASDAAAAPAIEAASG
ncbi:MAG: HAMP domain-containing sensor histidine kinase [Planctomycetota bacterium]|nr:cell wall metabolism sensor histidine kinase WalK [Planctomycetota bacterium]MDW8373275.1 HAMP domain-containing sensor histidine kinase [Planctomycetota bacterium]